MGFISIDFGFGAARLHIYDPVPNVLPPLRLRRGNREVWQGARRLRRGGGRAELCSARGAGGVRLHRQRQGGRFAVGAADRHQVPVHTGGQARLAHPHAPAEDGEDGEYMDRSVLPTTTEVGTAL